ESWHTIAQVRQPPEKASATFETLPDGSYDFRVVPENGAGRQFGSIPARDRLIDNAPPEVALSGPSTPVHGRVRLSANATDAGSGVAVVVFQRARAGSSAWQRIGEATLPPYSVVFNTEPLKNGVYDLRASAVDRAHNPHV